MLLFVEGRGGEGESHCILREVGPMILFRYFGRGSRKQKKPMIQETAKPHHHSSLLVCNAEERSFKAFLDRTLIFKKSG